MLTEERQSFIINQLNRTSVIEVKDLVQQLNVSESTIRRDLSQLEQAGQLIRIHGGAKRIYQLDHDMPLAERTTSYHEVKELIAQEAASRVESGDTIFLDAGTTTYEMIPYLAEIEGVKVITNGLAQAQRIAEYQMEPVLLGGRLKVRTQAIVGAITIRQLSSYRFNKAFIGINSIDLTYGLTTPDEEEGTIKRLAHQAANEAYFLADHSKFDKVSFYQVRQLENARVITDQLTPNQRTGYQAVAHIKEVTQ